MVLAAYFDELCAFLRARADREGFDEQWFEAGPLRVKLLVEPGCSDLEIGVAFRSPEKTNGTSVSTLDPQPHAGLTVYVLKWSTGSIDQVLRPFLTDEKKTLQQLSSPDYTQQFVIRDEEHQMLKVFDQKNGIGLLAFRERDLLPPWELFSPLKEFIHLYALKHSCVLLHAASLAWPDQPDQGVLLVGPGGSGKSTLTAYGVEQGMLTNGDDYVLVDLRDDTPQCWSIYRTIKLHPSSPVLRKQNRWHTWRFDRLTGKSVMLADTVSQGGALLPQVALARVCGISLKPSLAVHHPKAHSILSDPYRHPYLHSCMSTIQQIPYRIDVTLSLAKQLHQSIPYEAHTIGPGIEGLQHALIALKGR
jgi:hypothetical protein